MLICLQLLGVEAPGHRLGPDGVNDVYALNVLVLAFLGADLAGIWLGVVKQ